MGGWMGWCQAEQNLQIWKKIMFYLELVHYLLVLQDLHLPRNCLCVLFLPNSSERQKKTDSLFPTTLKERQTQREGGKDRYADRVRQRGEQTDSDRMITDEVTSIYIKLLHWHSQIWKPALLVTESAVAEHSPL